MNRIIEISNLFNEIFVNLKANSVAPIKPNVYHMGFLSEVNKNGIKNNFNNQNIGVKYPFILCERPISYVDYKALQRTIYKTTMFFMDTFRYTGEENTTNTRSYNETVRDISKIITNFFGALKVGAKKSNLVGFVFDFQNVVQEVYAGINSDGAVIIKVDFDILIPDNCETVTLDYATFTNLPITDNDYELVGIIE